jgi:2-oxoglutarate dehydrogenase E2 component (dihydrolipoamide succinyltransferase)
MATKIILPEMGEGVIEGTLARWLVKPGDRVEQYAPIAEVETDKVTTETTAESAGTILELLVNEGQTVPVGTVLAYIGDPGESVPANGEAKPAATPAPAPAVSPASVAAPPPSTMAPAAPRAAYTGRISPVVGRIAAEHEVDLSQVPGTGRDGRITKQDVLAYVEQRGASPVPEQPAVVPATPSVAAISQPSVAPPPTITGATELLPLTNVRRSIADHMVMSKRTSPHVTTVFEIDFSQVAAHRRAHKDSFKSDGVNLTFTAYIVAATVQALKQHPLVNSTWSDDGILLRKDINIGMAAAIEDGLIVPVIKNADGLNLLGLARTINDLTHRARNKQLKPADVQGGTFSITNHGTSGSLFATPIINQPQAGILGVGMIEKRVKVIDDAIAIRPQAYVSFTFDHRILDGASADAFVSTIKDAIEGWR